MVSRTAKREIIQPVPCEDCGTGWKRNPDGDTGTEAYIPTRPGWGAIVTDRDIVPFDVVGWTCPVCEVDRVSLPDDDSVYGDIDDVREAIEAGEVSP